MSNAPRDENRITTLLGASNADGITPVVLWADPVTHKLLVQWAVSNGAGSPSSTPTALGQVYIDTNAAKVYMSTGTSSSGDWKILN